MSAKARRKVGNLKTSLNISSAKLYLECFSFHIYMYINPKIKFTVPQHKWFFAYSGNLSFNYFCSFFTITKVFTKVFFSKRNGSLLMRHSDFKGVTRICKDSFLKSESFPVKIIPRVQVTLGLHTFQRALLLAMF